MANMTRGRNGPRTVGSLLPKITGKVLAKKGFPNMSLITDWPAIVGPQLARHTCPEKMNWPRPPRDLPEGEEGEAREPKHAGRARRPGTGKPPKGISLRLRVESHMALDVQYQLEEIMERINSYFGYRAVTDIRLIQGPICRSEAENKIHNDHIMCKSNKPLADLSKVRDDDLRKALERLDAARRS